MKPLAGIALALLLGVPVSALAEDLGQCSGLFYPSQVSDVLIEFSGHEVIPLEFQLEYRIGGDPVDTTQVQADAGRNYWAGSTKYGFKRTEIDIRPNLSGLSVSGPETCEYKPLGKRCALAFRFRADRVKISLQSNPPGTAIRIKPAAARPPNVDEDCVPQDVAWRLEGAGSASDPTLARRVRDALAAAPELAPYALEVAIRRRVVVLTGVVRDETAKRRAQQIAGAAATGITVSAENLRLSQLDDGTSLVEMDIPTVEIEKMTGASLDFRSQLKVRWDLLREGKPWPVTRAELAKGFIPATGGESGTATERQQGQVKHERTAKQYIDAKLGDVKGITIERSQW